MLCKSYYYRVSVLLSIMVACAYELRSEVQPQQGLYPKEACDIMSNEHMLISMSKLGDTLEYIRALTQEQDSVRAIAKFCPRSGEGATQANPEELADVMEESAILLDRYHTQMPQEKLALILSTLGEYQEILTKCGKPENDFIKRSARISALRGLRILSDTFFAKNVRIHGSETVGHNVKIKGNLTVDGKIRACGISNLCKFIKKHRGRRGKRGHTGPTGATGATGATGPAGACVCTGATGNFTVAGQLCVGGQILAPSGSPAVPGYAFCVTDQNTGFYNPAKGNIGVSINGAEFIRINGTGIGIGTTAPTQQIDMTGNINLVNSTATAGNILKEEAPFIHNFGIANTFVGVDSGNFTAAPPILNSGNTAIGALSLNSMVQSALNVAGGLSALQSLTGGNRNTAVGAFAGQDLLTGDINTACGFSALSNVTGSAGNTACGAFALQNNFVGQSNTACGNGALVSCTGNFNTALGVDAGVNLISGDNNLYLASPGATSGTESNTIHMGDDGTKTSCFIGGIFGVTVPGGTTVFIDSTGQLGTVVSSSKYKENIQDLENAGEKLMQLRPVKFNYKREYGDPNEWQCGCLAEEVEQKMPELVIKKDGEPYTVRYHLLSVLLLRAFQEQQQHIEKLEKRIQDLEQ